VRRRTLGLSVVLFSVQTMPEHESAWRGVFRNLGVSFDGLVVDDLIDGLGPSLAPSRGRT
jgi:hypothetical protein